MDSLEFANFIISRTVKRISLKFEDLPMFGKPMVYMAIGSDEVLYIGMSANGLQRVFRADHHVISKIHKDIISIELYETATPQEAKNLESKLIKEFRPKYNGRKFAKKEWNAAKILNYVMG